MSLLARESWRDLRVELLATGSELLDGSISDAHTRYLANQLRPLGHKIYRTLVVSDEVSEIEAGLRECFSRSDVLIVSGGLGPTTDDRTLEVAASVFGSRLVESLEAKENVLRMANRHGRKVLNDGHRKMFLIPEGSEVIANLAGAAPAVKWTFGEKTLFFLPGPPHEFSCVVEDYVLNWFAKRSQGLSEQLIVLKVFGWPESELSELMKKIQFPDSVTDIGFRTSLPENHIKIFVKAKSHTEALSVLQKQLNEIRGHLGDSLFSENPKESFPEAIIRKLKAKKRKVAVAESCTGGLVSHLLTSVSGSSAVFDRSFITYSNESKMELLKVNEESLNSEGAVSELVAKEMAVGALENSNADVAVSITGIAGPNGGTKDKPVGTIWLARADSEGVQTKLLNLRFDRHLNQSFTAYTALKWLGSRH